MILDELDRLAAEKLMGYTLVDESRWENDTHCLFSIGSDDFPQWQPTRNIDQAWMCLENCGFNDYSVRALPRTVELTPVFACTIHDEYFMCGSGHEVSAPLAIVKACLKAKGVEV